MSSRPFFLTLIIIMLSNSTLSKVKFPALPSNLGRQLQSFSLSDVVRSAAKLFSPLYRFAATSQVVSSTTETTLVSYTIPGNFSSTDLLKLLLSIRSKNNSGSSITLTLRVKVDGNTVATSTNTLTDSASSNYGTLDVTFHHNRTNTNVNGSFFVGNGNTSAIASTSSFALSSNATISVTAQLSASNAQAQFELLGGFTKIID